MTASCARNTTGFRFPSPLRARELAAFRRGMELGRNLTAQAPNRVKFTVTIIARDAWMFGLAIGLLAGVAIGHWVRL